MRKDRLYDRIHRDLMPEPLEPASDEFYEGVWKRIRNRERQVHSGRRRERPQVPFGTACWRWVPVFGVFLLVSAFFFWNYQDSTDEQALSSAESYVLDTGEIPSNEELLYQIFFPSNSVGLEKNP